MSKSIGGGGTANILKLIHGYRLKPKHRLGQNFLIDDSVYEDIIGAAKLSLDDVVLEIGAGLGTLTERLSPLVKQVIAVELDHKLAVILRRRLAQRVNIKIIEKNILAVPLTDFGVRRPYKVVANIPYNITGAFFKKFLTQDTQPAAMTVLVQREVGQRIVAKPGRMSLLALSVQLYATPVLVRPVSASSFYPSPQVNSVILNVLDIHSFPFADVDEKLFWRVARIGFAARRKQLHNNLSAGLRLTAVQAGAVLKEAGLAPKVRAEDLSVIDWSNLAKRLRFFVQNRAWDKI